MKWLDSVGNLISVFRKDEHGNLYSVELSKEQAWYIGSTANEFSHLSADYIKSSAALIQLNKDIAQSFGVVPAYLALRGLELKLKGALHSIDKSTYTVQELRKRTFGHNINNLLTEYHKFLDSVFDQFEQEKRDQIVDVFYNFSIKDYEYLDSRHGDQGVQLVVNFEFIEEVVFKIIDTINLQLELFFSFQSKAKSIITERQKLHPNDPAVENYWDELSTHLSTNEKLTIIFINQCNKDEVLLLSEIFEDISLKLKSQQFIESLKQLQSKFSELDLRSSIDIAERYSRY